MVDFVISAWSGWTPSGVAKKGGELDSIEASEQDAVYFQASRIKNGTKPDVSSIPPLLRRRLNLLGRACGSEVLMLLREEWPEEDGIESHMPLVYCSRHGDIERTLAVLMEMAKAGTVSPNNFSLAVHNAICGVLSIHAKLKGSINSIAAGEQSMVPVLLEAIGMLSPSCSKVLCVVCDVPLPEVYRSGGGEPVQPFSVCFTVAAAGYIGAYSQPLKLNQLTKSSGGAVVSPLDFCRFLLEDSKELLMLPHNNSTWKVEKAINIARG